MHNEYTGFGGGGRSEQSFRMEAAEITNRLESLRANSAQRGELEAARQTAIESADERQRQRRARNALAGRRTIGNVR